MNAPDEQDEDADPIPGLRALGLAMPGGDQSVREQFFDEVDSADDWGGAFASLFAVAGQLLVEVAARSNRTVHQALRDLAERVAGQAGLDAVPPAPPAPAEHRKHRRFEEIVSIISQSAVNRGPDDDPDDDFFACVPASLAALSAFAGTVHAETDVLGDLIRDYDDEHGGLKDLVIGLIYINNLSLALVRMFGGPEPEETLRAYGLGIAAASAGLKPDEP
jgi:hypothetical protein